MQSLQAAHIICVSVQSCNLYAVILLVAHTHTHTHTLMPNCVDLHCVLQHRGHCSVLLHVLFSVWDVKFLIEIACLSEVELLGLL